MTCRVPLPTRFNDQLGCGRLSTLRPAQAQNSAEPALQRGDRRRDPAQLPADSWFVNNTSLKLSAREAFWTAVTERSEATAFHPGGRDQAETPTPAAIGDEVPSCLSAGPEDPLIPNQKHEGELRGLRAWVTPG